MGIIGSQVDEINAIRKNLGTGTIKISKNVEIEGVEKKKAVVFEKEQDIIEFKFKFYINYNDKSSIELKGTVFYEEPKKGELDDFIKNWNEKKKIDTSKVIPILNHALGLGYKTAFSISEMLRLPTPMQLPKFVGKEEKPKKK